jgi:molecular chaperone DnaK
MTQEETGKHTRAEKLILQAERQLREVALDFGMQFAPSHRQQIDNICQELRSVLQQNNDRGIDQAYSDLQDALHELKREVSQYYPENSEDDLWNSEGDNSEDDLWNNQDDNIGGSPPIPRPRRPGPRPGSFDSSAVLPPTDHYQER